MQGLADQGGAGHLDGFDAEVSGGFGEDGQHAEVEGVVGHDEGQRDAQEPRDDGHEGPERVRQDATFSRVSRTDLLRLSQSLVRL